MNLRWYWGLDGAEDLADYARFREETEPSTWFSNFGSSNTWAAVSALTDGGYDDFLGPSVFVNLSANYRYSPNLTFDAHIYNLLGLIDYKYNKRNYLYSVSDYRVDTESLMFKLSYEF